MKLSRRHLLALASLSAVAGGVGEASVWWRTTPATALVHLEADEAEFLRALAGILETS